MAASNVRYLVFDVESVADPQLVSALRFPTEGLEGREAVRRYRSELMDKLGSDFVPYTFQLPVCVVVGKLTAEFQLIDLVVLDEPQSRPHVIAENFWRGWEAYRRPTFVSFNGRGFDLPLLELAAFRFGINLSTWFAATAKTYEQPRNRYNTNAHIDLCDFLTNFGATRFTGGLNLAANILGKPGKMDVQGDMVQDMFDAGRLSEINDYCRCDVLDTYFVFLRSRVILGQLTLQQEHALIGQTKAWLEQNAAAQPAYRLYLQKWGDWENPWTSAENQP